MNHAEIIETDDGLIKLVRLVYDDKESDAWIEFKDLEKGSVIWDNDNFVFIKFYKFLKRWKNEKLKKKDKNTFEDIWLFLDDNSVKELIQMLDYAIEKGWYYPIENLDK